MTFFWGLKFILTSPRSPKTVSSPLGHEIGLESVCGADICCIRHCRASLVQTRAPGGPEASNFRFSVDVGVGSGGLDSAIFIGSILVKKSSHALPHQRGDHFISVVWSRTAPHQGAFIVGLTSIVWRNAWKYGDPGFRYTHHDVGLRIGRDGQWPVTDVFPHVGF